AKASAVLRPAGNFSLLVHCAAGAARTAELAAQRRSAGCPESRKVTKGKHVSAKHPSGGTARSSVKGCRLRIQLVRRELIRCPLRLRRRTCMRSERRFRSERPSCPGTFICLQNFVQVLLGRLCFQGVSWLLLCTSKEVTRCPQDSGSFALASKEVTRCPQDSGSFALASKEVTRSACGR